MIYFSAPLNGFILHVLALRLNQKVNGFVQNVHKIERRNNSSNIFFYICIIIVEIFYNIRFILNNVF